MQKHNFSAGPSILPQEVFQEAAKGIMNYENIGLSILEISHRSKEFDRVMNEAITLVRELLDIPEEYAVLFLSGGASSQFFMGPMNLLNNHEKAAYIDTGSWSSKAIKEANQFGSIEVVASSKEENYTYIPKGYTIPSDAKFLHFTSNNTIFGTQYHHWPETNLPLLCDMSSDIFSRPIPINKFGLVYAGAQKNMGPAGTTLVIVRKDLLGKIDRTIPTMLKYSTHIEKNSMFHTPPVYAVYVSMLTLRWLKNNGGVTWVQERNRMKAELLYTEIDRNPFFTGVSKPDDRSVMNATFVLKNEDLNSEFLTLCETAGCSGVKGHRSVGGFRASMYNAMPLESVAVLVEVMQEFEKKFG